jgi:hypothetical protein
VRTASAAASTTRIRNSGTLVARTLVAMTITPGSGDPERYRRPSAAAMVAA